MNADCNPCGPCRSTNTLDCRAAFAITEYLRHREAERRGFSLRSFCKMRTKPLMSINRVVGAKTGIAQEYKFCYLKFH